MGFSNLFSLFPARRRLWLSSLDGQDLSVRRQELDLYRASHTMELIGGGRVESFVYADGNVLALRLSGLRGRELQLQPSPEAVDIIGTEHDGELQQSIRREVFRQLKRQWTDKQGSLQIDYADGHRSLLFFQVRGARLETEDQAASMARLVVEDDSAEILLTIVTSREGAFLSRRAGLLLETAWQRGFDRLRYDHENIWHERWLRSSVQLPERVLEALWCYTTYTMASSSRGAYPAPLMSAWNLSLAQPYGGDYHNNINSQMCYWPLLASNQCDLLKPYIRHFWSVMPEMEMETRRVWGIDGIKVPFASIGRGIDHWGVGYWRYELFVSAWLAQVAWWHYEFTGDRDWLRDYGWGLIRGVAEFYVNYLETDPATGKLSLPLSKLCEDTMFNVAPSQRLVRDAGMDLTAVHGHLRDAAQAADALGLTVDANRYRQTLANLNGVPQINGEFALARDVSLDVPISHPYTIVPIYPTGLVTQLGPQELLPVAQRTLKHIWRCSSRVTMGQPDQQRLRWNDDLSMGWIGVARAWMGDGDGALDALLNGWVTSTLKSNGFLSEQSRAPQERPGMMWMQNQLCGLTNGVNEMLLQSHSGVIQIFPAMPGSWDQVRFIQLRARPGVLVSAQWENGATRWVVLNAQHPCTIRLRNPWPEISLEQIVVIDTTSGATTHPESIDADGHLVLNLVADQPLLLARQGQEPGDIAIDIPQEQPNEPWSFTGPIQLRKDDPAPDGTWTSWWGRA